MTYGIILLKMYIQTLESEDFIMIKIGKSIMYCIGIMLLGLLLRYNLSCVYAETEEVSKEAEEHLSNEKTDYVLMDGYLNVKLDDGKFFVYLQDNSSNLEALESDYISKESVDAYMKMLGYELLAFSSESYFPDNNYDIIIKKKDSEYAGIKDLRDFPGLDQYLLAGKTTAEYHQSTYSVYETETADYITFETLDSVFYITIKDGSEVFFYIRAKYCELTDELRDLMKSFIDETTWNTDKTESQMVNAAGTQGETATLMSGEKMNELFQELALNDSALAEGEDAADRIRTFQRSLSPAPSDAKTIILSEEGTSEVTAWYENGDIFWYSEAETVRAVDMSRMFWGFSNLIKADLSGIDTSAVLSMRDMFLACSSLEEPDLTGLDTSNVISMNGMFLYCHSLKKVDLSSFDTSNVLDMDSMFDDCNELKALDLSSFDTSKVTNMGCMFYMCTSLEQLDLSGFDTSNVRSMETMFRNCASLTELDLSGFDTSNVYDMYSMFEGCSNLKKLDISAFDTGNVLNMDYMFCYCESLEELDLSSFDTSNVTEMRCMFNGCESLRELDLGSFDTTNVTDMESMFDGCHNLEYMDLHRFNLQNTMDTFAMFHGCENLSTVKSDDPRVQRKIYDIVVRGYDGMGVG